MRYSLLHRFQGILAGAAIAEAMAGVSDISGKRAPASTMTSAWRSLAARSTETLIQTGTWSHESAKRIFLETAVSLSGIELAIATLPLTLFFHDDALKLQQTLSQTVQLWQGDAEAEAQVFAVGYTIAQALNEQLAPARLVPQLIAALPTTSSLIQPLERVQQWVQQQTNLATVAAELGLAPSRDAGAIGLALYSFLTTPDDLRLSVQRAARVAPERTLVWALTAAFSGAYNSAAGLPLEWRLAAIELNLDSGELADRLLATWAGAYGDTTLGDQAIAAPNVIRPR